MSEISAKKVLFLGLALTLGVYLPGLSGSFFHDDLPAITLNSTLQTTDISVAGAWQAMWSYDESGPLGRPISMLSLWGNYLIATLDARVYKLTNIAIHLINGYLMYAFCLLSLRAWSEVNPNQSQPLDSNRTQAVALLAATVWLLHPLNMSSVLYVVQRMTSLSSMFMLLAAIGYVRARLRHLEGESSLLLMTTSFVTFGSAALLSKETAALLPLYLFALEATLFQFKTAIKKHQNELKLFFLCFLALPALIATPYLFDVITPEAYTNRDFTVGERILTQSRVIWYYLLWIVFPIPQLMGLHHDDIAISSGIFQPETTALATAGIISLLIAAVVLRKKAPMLSFTIAWYFAGHLLESTIFPLEMAYEHRNYLPMVGVAFGFAYGLHSLGARISSKVLALIAACIIAALATSTALRAIQWGDPVNLMISEAENHPKSARAHTDAGIALLQQGMASSNLVKRNQRIKDAISHLETATRLNQSAINAHPALISAADALGEPVKPRWIEDLKKRLAEKPEKISPPMMGLVTHQINAPKASLNEKQVNELFSIALDNDRVTGFQKGQLAAIWAKYQFSIGNIQKGVTLIVASTEFAPSSIKLRFELAEVAVQLKNYELAHQELEKIKDLDPYKKHARRIREIEDMLADR